MPRPPEWGCDPHSLAPQTLLVFPMSSLAVGVEALRTAALQRTGQGAHAEGTESSAGQTDGWCRPPSYG